MSRRPAGRHDFLVDRDPDSHSRVGNAPSPRPRRPSSEVPSGVFDAVTDRLGDPESTSHSKNTREVTGDALVDLDDATV